MKYYIVVVSFVLLFVQCSTPNQRTYYPPGAPVPHKLVKRANRFHTELMSRGVIYGDSTTHNFLEIVGRPIVDTLFPRMSIQFYTLRQSEINAYALLNGNTYITIGALMRLETVSQVAFLLAHELAHIRLNHGVNKHEQQKAATTNARFLDIVLLRTGVAYIPAASVLARFTRKQEFEADSVALALLNQWRYPLATVPSVFQIIEEGRQSTAGKGALYQSHPSFQERERRLTTFIHAEHQNRYISDEITAQFSRVRSRLFEEYIRMSLRQRNYTFARRIIKPAMTKHPTMPLYHYYAGELYRLQAAHLQEFAEDYVRFHPTFNVQEVQRFFSDSLDVWYSQAQEEYTKALQLESSFVRGYRGLGLVAYHIGKYQAGIDYLQQYIARADAISDRLYLQYLIRQMEEKL